MKVLTIDAVGSKALGADVRDKASAYPVPAGLLTLPLKGAAGPGQFLSIEETTHRADNLVDKASAW